MPPSSLLVPVPDRASPCARFVVVLPPFELDHMDDGVDQCQVGEGLREVSKLLAGMRVDLLAVQFEFPANDSSLAQSFRARSYSPISQSVDTSQKEQIVKLPSSPVNPSSVSSTLRAAPVRAP